MNFIIIIIFISYVYLFMIHKNIRILMMGRDVTNSVRRVVWHMFFLSFCFTQEELSKVILSIFSQKKRVTQK